MQYSTAGTAAGRAASTMTISAAAVTFANGRKISRATLERLGVASGMAYFQELSAEGEALIFPYRQGWKARALKTKAYTAGKGFKLDFWNVDAVVAGGQETVFLTEGELDACALVEAGVPADAVLSVPNGAKERPADDPVELRSYEYVTETLANGLGKAKRFVWCGDSDGPGLALRADMARLVGAARFWFVEWPEGCKDANDVLCSDGGTFLREMVSDGALPWPVAGLYRLSDLPEPAPLAVWSTGMAGWDRKIMLAPRTLSVVTGQPGHGKTLLFGQLFFQIVRRYGVCACIASFESRPKPHLRRQLRTLKSGKLERDMDDHERRDADDWINERYWFLVHPDQRPTLDWFLDSAEVAVVRHGAKIIQLDPWNRLEATRARNESETEYIGRCLRELYNFATDLNCHVQIVAHPAKMEGKLRKQPPELEDISGSKAWDAMVDQGFTVYRPMMYEGTERRTQANLYHRKSRFEELGYPCKMELTYKIDEGRYEVLKPKTLPNHTDVADGDDM